MNITIADAISSLNPNVSFSVDNDIIVAWDLANQGHTKPTDAEIATELTRLQAVYDSQLYARTRKAKYDLLNQDEMRYDDMVNNTTTWRDGIAAIKTAHPKP